MIRLWLGPLRSGKTTQILDSVRGHLREQSPFRLLTPTAAMAEQVTHKLAREGLAVPGKAVTTLARFLNEHAAGNPLITGGAQRHLMRLALEAQRPGVFRAIGTAAGLVDLLARVQEELFNAGADALTIAGQVQMGVLRGHEWPAVAALFAQVETAMEQRGLIFRATQVRQLARTIRRQGLPEAGEIYVDGFFALNQAERELLRALAGWTTVTVTLPEWPGAQSSIEWLRRQGVSISRLAVAGRAPVITRVTAGSMDDEVLDVTRRMLEAARAGRRFSEMAVILRTAEPYVPMLRTALARFSIPARFYFPGRLTSTPVFAGLPEPGDVELWRARAARLSAIQSVLEEAEPFLDPPATSLEELRLRAPEFVEEAAVRFPDPGPDSVSVIDVYEARQWERPLVFLCGVQEGTFPKRTPTDPLLTAEIREQLASLGTAVDTALDRAREEEFLFEIAISRATEEAVLTCHTFDSRGEPVTPALALARFPGEPERAVRIRRTPGRIPEPAPVSAILRPALLAEIQERHSLLSASAIESYLQCPFQFFGRYPLGLRNVVKEEEAWSILQQGRLLHDVLRDWHRNPGQNIRIAFERHWAKMLASGEAPDGYRAEFARSVLLRSFDDIAKKETFPAGWTVHAEEEIKVEFDGVAVRGRIDRFDSNAEGDCHLYEYKFVTENGLKVRVDRQEAGRMIQGGLYLLALERAGYRPAGYTLAAVRGEYNPETWTHPAELRELIGQARQQTIATAQRLAAGEIRPQPADRKQCRYCDLRDACRERSVGEAEGEAAAAAE